MVNKTASDDASTKNPTVVVEVSNAALASGAMVAPRSVENKHLVATCIHLYVSGRIELNSTMQINLETRLMHIFICIYVYYTCIIYHMIYTTHTYIYHVYVYIYMCRGLGFVEPSSSPLGIPRCQSPLPSTPWVCPRRNITGLQRAQ